MNSIKQIAKDKGISKRELSDKSGVNYWAIDEYYRETVDVNNITMENLVRLCLTLDCKVSDIIDDQKRIKELKKLLTLTNVRKLF
jgi:DNA-binding Xre family transcriptional regulator